VATIGASEAADYAKDFLIAAGDVETHEASIANALIGIGWTLYAQTRLALDALPPSYIIVDEELKE
jgi:hypothetical protein